MYSHSRGDKKIERILKKRRKTAKALTPDVVLPRQKPLKLPKHGQRKDNCGPASLRIVAEYFGRTYGERELAKLLGTNAKEGTSHESLIAGAEKLGATVFAMHRGKMSDLRYFLHEGHLPVIVAWYSPDRPRFKKFRLDTDYPWGHFSVVYHVTRTHVYMMDPDKEGSRRKLSVKRFKYLWWDTDSRKKTCVRHWFMVASFPDAAAPIAPPKPLRKKSR